MNKADIARKIHEAAEIDLPQAGEALERVLDLIKTALKNGESIAVANFGTFKVRSKNERRGRNPRTGEEVIIAARKVVRFQASPAFKEYINPENSMDERPGVDA